LVRWAGTLAGRDLSLDLNIENLLDTDYINPGPYVGNPINFKFTARMRF
jgi:outer membrane receptor protein involved in Fe transport